MKIAIVVGTYRKNGNGMSHLKKIEKAVKSKYPAEFDYLFLGDCDIKTCRGCMACYEQGEGKCPLKDGYLAAIKRLGSADAAIFYTPTYTLSVSGLIKTFFDRSSYVLHRPYFSGKYALLLTGTAFFGERAALKTLKTVVSAMGFSIAGCLGVVEEKYAKNLEYKKSFNKKLQKAALSFAGSVFGHKPVRPGLLRLMAFVFQKRIFLSPHGGAKSDKEFWQQKGWLKPETPITATRTSLK